VKERVRHTNQMKSNSVLLYILPLGEVTEVWNRLPVEYTDGCADLSCTRTVCTHTITL
jgi:hypothetical protein